MDRLLAGGTVNAAQSGRGPALFLFHSLLSDRASFDAVAPRLSQSFRVIVPELPGFGGSKGVSGGLAAVADRMAETVREAAGGGETIVLGNGYGGFVALQMAIRHPGIATRLIFADCGAAFSDEGRQAFRNMAVASKTKGLQAITDVAMRRLFAPEFQESHPDLMRDRREQRSSQHQQNESKRAHVPGRQSQPKPQQRASCERDGGSPRRRHLGRCPGRHGTARGMGFRRRRSRGGSDTGSIPRVVRHRTDSPRRER